MKREIKFKAKCLDNGEWCEGYFYEENGNTYIIENRQKESMLNRNVTYEVDPSTVCQFTGLTDCEGKEIWEGDILEHTQSNARFTVMFSDFGAFFIRRNDTENSYIYLFELTEKDKCLTLFEVVGNKFDKEK